MTCLLDTLPAETLDIIASSDMSTYYLLISTYPRFARSVTNGRRFDYAIAFGVDYHVRSHNLGYRAIWSLNNVAHRADGPAIINCYSDYRDNILSYCIRGEKHRTDGPAYISGNICTYYHRGNPIIRYSLRIKDEAGEIIAADPDYVYW